MNCPNCNQKMTPGTAQVRGSFWSFFLVGFSMQDLWFDRNGRSECKLPSREQRGAYCCEECGGVFLPSRDKELRRSADPRTGVVTVRD
jgi:hypothetical protein